VNMGQSDRWPEIERLLDQVLDSEPGARPELLAKIRADDPELAAEIDRLLRAMTAAGTFLEESATSYAAPLITRIFNANDLAPGTRLGTYEIVRELGRGGTATVYLAHDARHGRQVAIKVPHAELASMLGPERFLREIQIAAQLQHPNILPLHDSGEVDGVLYYVMPYVEGESLRQRLEREVQLSIHDALHIAIQVADALAYAHRHGVVHRDIKPENILLSGVHAQVADFGIARAMTMAGGERLQETGPLGTAPYMSPEQASAGSHLDGRSDIYSLGCVLYEMLVGEVPFKGINSQAVLMQHMQAPVPNLSIVRPTVSAELKQVILTALAKVPGDRFATAGDLVTALEGVSPRALPPRRDRVAIFAAALLAIALVGVIAVRAAPIHPGRSSAAAAEVPRIAVLYLRDLSPGSTLRQVADRITENLISELSGVNAFQVISRNGVEAYRHQASLDNMVQALGVNTVVDGSIQPWGDRLRLRVQLVDAESKTDIDSVVIERRMTDPAAFEQSVAEELAARLRRQMGRRARLQTAPLGTSSDVAKELAEKAQRAREDARRIAESQHSQDIKTAVETLNRADSLLASAQLADPKWTRLWIDRGWVAAERARLLTTNDRIDALQGGMRLAEEAVKQAPNSAEALELRGTLRSRLIFESMASPDGLDMQKAEADLRAALDRDSTLTVAWASLSDLLWTKGSTAEADIAIHRALRQDAYLTEAFDIYWILFFNQLMLGNFADAGQWCRRGRVTFPGNWRFVECDLTLMRHDQASKPNPDSAWMLVRALDRIDPAERAELEGRAYHTIYRRVVAATISSRAGRKDIARAEIARARRATAGDTTLSVDLGYDEAYLRLVLGERDRAIHLLQAYVKARPLTRDYLSRDPLLRDLAAAIR
jgi:eukaryotic-like serine/threonine-protein kinase